MDGKGYVTMKEASADKKKKGAKTKKDGETLTQEKKSKTEISDEEEKDVKGSPVSEGTGAGKEDSGPAESPQESSPTPEDQENEPGGEENGARESLPDDLEICTREKEELEDKNLRLRADFENFRKRVNKEKANLIQYGNESLLGDLLPVIDNIERILTYSLQETGWERFREGVELVLTEIHKTLSRYGVQALDALGKDFDPTLHEAMQRVETDETPPNIVLEVYQKGYLYHEKLLRPSRVAVAVAPQEDVKGEEGAQEGEAPEENVNKGAPNQDKKIIQ